MQNCGENGAAERMCRRKLAGLSEPKWRFSAPLWGPLVWWRDIFGFFGLAERDERHDGVKTVGRGARGRVCSAKNVFFGSRRGDFAFRHFGSKAKKSTAGGWNKKPLLVAML